MISTVQSKILVHTANQDAVRQVVSDGGADAEKLYPGVPLRTARMFETRINCEIGRAHV